MSQEAGPAGPLEGLRVLDLTTQIAGPYCTKLFATCGADVIKVEPPGGDPFRRCGPFDADDNSLGFLDLNVGKRGITLDLRRDRDRVLGLAAGADAVVESLRPGALERLGLGYHELRHVNPRLVLTSITNFGQTGPYRDLPASELVLYGMGHEMYGTGQPDREPMSMAPRLNLCFAGKTAAVATLAAVLHGRGDWIDVSIMETLVASIDRRADSLVSYIYCGEKMVRMASVTGPGGPPLYTRALDGWVQGRPLPDAWPVIERIVEEDGEPGDELLDRWLSWCASHTKLDAVSRLQAGGLPAAPVNSVADLAADEHLAARGFFEEVGGRKHVGPFAKFSETPARLGWPAPRLGEHQGAVWLEPEGPAEPRADQPNPGTLPLEGVRVLDLGVVLAGTYGTMMLGDLGAEVIRIESTKHFVSMTRGQSARPSKELVARMPPISGGYPGREPGERPWNRFPWFNQTARNKLGATIDLRSGIGRAAFLRLVATADVLVTNQSHGTLERLGVGWEVCKEVNPRLIYVDATSFGATGPLRSWRGFGTQMEAFAGHELLRTYRDLDVDKNTWAVTADSAGALAIAFAAQAGLHARRRTRRGQYIDISITENFLGLIGAAVLDFTATGRIQPALGNRDYTAVQGCYPCAGEDRWLVLTIRDDDDWAGVLRATGWEPEERLATVESRYAHHDELDDRFAGWTRALSREDAVDRLRAEGVPAGPVLDDADAYADPHLIERGFFWEITQEETGTHLYPGAPYRFRNVALGARLPAVRLGEHNEYVWRGLVGLSDEEYAELEADGQIGMEYAPEVG